MWKNPILTMEKKTTGSKTINMNSLYEIELRIFYLIANPKTYYLKPIT